jgi:hypothetical protein
MAGLSLTLCTAPILAKGDGILLAWSSADVLGITEESLNAAKLIPIHTLIDISQ